MPSRKWCFVPVCKNTSCITPNKIFVSVPKDIKRRQKWFAAARRNISEVSKKSTMYCCEDHFDLKEDMENYIEYTLSKVSARMKPNIVPHIFSDHVDKFTTSFTAKRVRESGEKRSRKLKMSEFLQQAEAPHPEPLVPSENGKENEPMAITASTS
ncbi:hypothetical protein PPYR_11727 [Photinus pyralis]|uniref:THAP-type domain-containing protein n=1 Tax=Photinus pyralis TaxID=7054 RepID=A0A1Y1MQW3_PHOPY|nr:hypothetical protein PPYR_11727 [Photinus pyralis]